MANKVITVLEADGVTETDIIVLDTGRQDEVASKSVTLASQDKSVLDTISKETTAQAILDKLPSTPATEASSAAILAKLIAAPATAANQATTNTALDTLATQTTSVAILAKLIAAPATEAKQDVLNAAVDGLEAQIGIVTETAPGTDTASSGLNGRLQRIAQRITSLIALIPAALGLSGGLKVDDIFSQYEHVAVSTTAKLGATGAQGDYLAGVLIIPDAAAAGVVQIQDGNATAITIFAGGGTTALCDLKPFLVPLGLYATVGTTGGWNIITNASVRAIGIGKFT